MARMVIMTPWTLGSSPPGPMEGVPCRLRRFQWDGLFGSKSRPLRVRVHGPGRDWEPPSPPPCGFHRKRRATSFGASAAAVALPWGHVGNPNLRVTIREGALEPQVSADAHRCRKNPSPGSPGYMRSSMVHGILGGSTAASMAHPIQPCLTMHPGLASRLRLRLGIVAFRVDPGGARPQGIPAWFPSATRSPMWDWHGADGP